MFCFFLMFFLQKIWGNVGFYIYLQTKSQLYYYNNKKLKAYRSTIT